MEQALYQAAILTFEELLFAFPVAGTNEVGIDDANSVEVAVGFHGPFSGELVLRIENDALSAVASNMLGDEEPLREEMLRDVLGEIANVICGNALPAIAGKQEIFRLNAPDFRAVPVRVSEASAIAHIGLDEGKADISIYLN
jgi:CheY-specific phosphatase CheX